MPKIIPKHRINKKHVEKKLTVIFTLIIIIIWAIILIVIVIWAVWIIKCHTDDA